MIEKNSETKYMYPSQAYKPKLRLTVFFTLRSPCLEPLALARLASGTCGEAARLVTIFVIGKKNM
jgi:hypothetical protein